MQHQTKIARRTKPPIKRSRIILIAVLAVLFLLAIAKLASNKQKINAKNKPVDKSNYTIPVGITLPKMLGVNATLIKSGTLIPFEEADIVATMSGKVTSVRFKEGSRVGRGGIVATIDMGMENIGLNDARQRVSKLEKDYRIQQELLAADGTTQSRLDDVRLSLQAARNQVAQMQKQVSDNNVRAPISGIVTERFILSGEFVNPGTTMGKLVDISRLKARVMVGEADVYTLRLGQEVKVTADVAPGDVFNGRISYISPQGDASHNFPVEVTLPNPGERLKASTIVNADFSLQSSEEVMQIPREALAESIKNPYVYVAKGPLAIRRNITVGREFGDYVEVLNGLTLNDTVIVSGQINLADSVKISVIK